MFSDDNQDAALPGLEGSTLTSIDGEGDPQARLERMKNEFLVAQQRRREKAAGPLQSGPADGTLTGIAAVRP